MNLYEAFCGLLTGGRVVDTGDAVETPEDVPQRPLQPTQAQLLVINRSPDSFYHSLTDEEFVGWLRGWGTSPQVLRPQDREILLERARAESLALDT